MPSLLATLGLDASNFQQKLTESQKLAGRAGQQMSQQLLGPLKMGLGAMAGAMVANAGRQLVQMAGHYQDLADQFRTSAETVQQWSVAAERAGLKAEDMGTALLRLKKARAEAVEKGELGGFRAFGISMAALKDSTVSTEQILRRMAELTAGGVVSEEQDVAGMELMGKSGARILAAFQELHNLGPLELLTDEQVASLDKASEALAELKRQAAVKVGQAYTAAVLSPKALWQMGKDLWNYAFGGGQEAPRFGGPGSDPYGGFTVTSQGQAGSLYQAPEAAVGLSAAERKSLEKMQVDLAEKMYQNALKRMSVDERRAEIARAIENHEERAAAAREKGDLLEEAQARLAAEELRSELMGMRQSGGGGGKLGRSSQDLNELQRIGAWTRGISGTDRAILNIDRNVNKIADRPTPTGDLGGF